MLLYKVLSTSQRPIPVLEVDSETFTNEWRACWEDKTRDMTYLIKLASPFITHWKNMLTTPSGTTDINYVSLCARFGEPQTAQALIRNWIKRSELISSVDDELWMLFIEHVRTANYYPKFASPLMAEFVITRDYKLKLVDSIKTSKHAVDLKQFGVIFDSNSYEEQLPDHLFLKNLALDRWETYLLQWLLDGRLPTEIEKATHIPYDTFKKEERYLCRLLKESYFKDIE